MDYIGDAPERQIHSLKNYDQAHKKYLSWIAQMKHSAVTGMSMILAQLIVLVLSIYLVSRGEATIGTIVLAQVYATQTISKLWGLSDISKAAEQAIANSSEMTEILGQKPTVKDPVQPKKLNVGNGRVDIRKISFAHDGSLKTLFKGFNLSIMPGEEVGLVGHSGSGKTSLVRLLLRFEDVDDGEICIDGQDIRDVAQADLRSHIAYVPQESILFHRTLRENIAYGMPNATDQEVEAAARQAHAHDFISALPEGYETTVGERGVKLSGGQRQRVAIARAILKNAPILILDEATSALDSESEKLVQAALWELLRDRTAIVIAHRLSTIQKMDRIVVLEDGRIVEQDSHNELVNNPNGTYAKLWKHQSGGFMKEDYENN